MKNFILKTGQRLINIAVAAGIIFSIIVAYGTALPAMEINVVAAVVTFIITATLSICGIIIAAFIVYLLIDIRDELKKLVEKK